MRIKKLAAGFLACLVLALSAAGACFAGGPDAGAPAAASDEAGSDRTAEAAASDESGAAGALETETARETVDAEKETFSETAGAGKETAPETAETEKETVDIPDNVTMGGTFPMPFDSIEELEQALAGTDGGDDAETETTGRVNVSKNSYLHLRGGAGMDQDIIGHLLAGDELEIVGEDGDWYQVAVKERTGYVHKDWVDVTEQTVSGSKTDDDRMALLLYLMMAGQAGMDNTEVGVPGASDNPDNPGDSDHPDNPDGTGDPSAALTPDGNLTLVDDYSEEHADGSGKQFITVTTKNDNYFYLVIDRDKDGNQNVHFMNLVDEADLLALMDEDEAAKYTGPAEPEKPPETDPAEPDDGDGNADADGEKEDAEKKPGTNMMPLLILAAALIGGGGLLAFTKLKGGQKKKVQEKPDPDADYVDGADEAESDIPDDMDEDYEDDVDADVGEDDDSTLFDADDKEPV